MRVHLLSKAVKLVIVFTSEPDSQKRESRGRNRNKFAARPACGPVLAREPLGHRHEDCRCSSENHFAQSPLCGKISLPTPGLFNSLLVLLRESPPSAPGSLRHLPLRDGAFCEWAPYQVADTHMTGHPFWVSWFPSTCLQTRATVASAVKNLNWMRQSRTGRCGRSRRPFFLLV